VEDVVGDMEEHRIRLWIRIFDALSRNLNAIKMDILGKAGVVLVSDEFQVATPKKLPPISFVFLNEVRIVLRS
jgi:hypothetical protein